MKYGYKLSLAAIVASLSLVGCGSDSTTVTPETVTGQFVDTYVAGLNYECSSGTTGITNNMGEYTCNVGDTVEFSLGGYVLGSTTASAGIVTPYDIQSTEAAAINVAQLLQSLDENPTDDIITIPENFTALDDVTVAIDDADFDELIEDVLDVPLISGEEAQEHLDETELTLLLSGKTFYSVSADNLGEVVINADVTFLSWTTIGGTEIGDTETEVLEVVGNTVVATDNGNYLIVTEETNDYLLINMYRADGTLDGEARWYFDQATAEAYYATLQDGHIILTQDMLTGTILYDSDTDISDNISTYSESAMIITDTSLTRQEFWYYDSNDSLSHTNEFTLDYELVDGKMKLEADSSYVWITLLSYGDGGSWIVEKAEDINKTGEIDETGGAEWYTSEPSGFTSEFTILQSVEDLETLLVGNTFYQSVRDLTQSPAGEWIATTTFNANGTIVTVDNGIPETKDYTIDGDTLTTVSITEGTKVYTLTDVTDTYIEFENSIDGTWYFTSEAAEAADPVIWD